ncbi:MAG: hypothetical protein J6Z11_08350 [Candidatus Riflebacteria bacterium]|nr:hypothetical protein [Candidatus Riflebacteria bacterium]
MRRLYPKSELKIVTKDILESAILTEKYEIVQIEHSYKKYYIVELILKETI